MVCAEAVQVTSAPWTAKRNAIEAAPMRAGRINFLMILFLFCDCSLVDEGNAVRLKAAPRPRDKREAPSDESGQPGRMFGGGEPRTRDPIGSGENNARLSGVIDAHRRRQHAKDKAELSASAVGKTGNHGPFTGMRTARCGNHIPRHGRVRGLLKVMALGASRSESVRHKHQQQAAQGRHPHDICQSAFHTVTLYTFSAIPACLQSAARTLMQINRAA
jgi:hypothetical protein